MGATVHSFDFDARSVACTRSLKDAYFPDDGGWTIGKGSVLDTDYLRTLKQFDIVYCWGVLHHTGDMWQAMKNIISLVYPGGQLFIAIYNDRGWRSDYWKRVKELYNKSTLSRMAITLPMDPICSGEACYTDC